MERKYFQAIGRSRQRSEGLPFFDLSLEGDHGRIASRKAAVKGISLVHAALPGSRPAVTVLRE
jgi:hypothetical protein